MRYEFLRKRQTIARKIAYFVRFHCHEMLPTNKARKSQSLSTSDVNRKRADVGQLEINYGILRLTTGRFQTEGHGNAEGSLSQ